MIPKVIYQTWKTQNLPSEVYKLHQKMLKKNVGYKHIVYTDEQMNDYMQSNAASDIKNMYFKLNNIVAKADVWRYTILLNKGGVYLDIDSEIIGSLSTLINEKDEGIITAEKNKNLFVQWALIFNRNHPILSLTLDNILRAISEEKYKFDHHSLTVKTYAEAIFTLSRNNGEEVDWSKIDTSTDKMFKCNNSTFRLYGIDYNKYFNFKHKFNHKLRDRNKGEFSKDHWTEEQKSKSIY